MQPSKSARTTVLAFTTALLIAVAIAIACAPTAPSSQVTEAPETISPNLITSQDDNGQNPPQAQQTTEQQSVSPQESSPTATIPPPLQPDGDPVIDSNLQTVIDRYNEDKAEHEQTRQTMEPVFVDIIVIVSHPDEVDDLVVFMKEHSTGHVYWGKGDETTAEAGGANGRVNIELIPTIALMPGVIDVHESRILDVNGKIPQSTNPTIPTAVQTLDALGVATWHAAGIDGTGTEIGIIDTDFRNFSRQVANPYSDRIKFLCYDSGGMTSETDFTACERPRLDSTGTPTINPHGTEVAKALDEIAPKAKLYISNANTAPQVRISTEWMTAKSTDNANQDSPYLVADNDNFNVKVINSSLSAPWDGPGDGTSPFNIPMNTSLLNIVNSAVANNVLWTSPAGNSAEQTWFSRALTLNSSNYLEFKTTGTDKRCNEVEIDKNVRYTVQLRWSGSWPRADIDLKLEVFRQIGNSTQFVTSKSDAQAGLDNQYPREILDFTTNNKGTYCLYVSIFPPGEMPDDRPQTIVKPDWVQIKISGPDVTLDPTTGSGSIGNPAESNNPGMLAVGATDNDATFTIMDDSSRGPAPEPEGRIKPDVVSINTDRAGTSFSAPRIAGLAALVIQALGGSVEPNEIANYLKTKVVPLGTSSPNNDYGYGLVKLPGLDPPTNLVLTHQPCNRDAHLLLTFDPPDWDGINEDGTNVRYRGFARLDPTIPGEISQVEGNPTTGENQLSFTTVRDATYYAVAEICPINGSSRMCSIKSQRSNHAVVPPEVCAPEQVNAVPGNRMITLRWNHERHATGYDVQQEHQNAIEVLEDQHKIFSNLTNRTTYRFRVRAKGVPGTSEWSEWITATPLPAAPTIIQQIVSDSLSGIYIRMHWDEIPGNAVYRVQQWDGTAGQWRSLPFREQGKSEPYGIHFFYQYGHSEAKVTGLTPGTSYTYRFKSINGSQISDWSQQFTFTASLPVGPPTLQPNPTPAPIPNKTEPRNLTATVSGTNVVLNWTKGENENFATQVVRRKTHEGGPTITEFSVTLDAETYTDTTTVSGTTYIYRIANVKNNGVDVISNYQYITVP